MVSVLGTLVLLTVIGLGIATISLVIAKWNEADAPRDRPTWLGPDPAAIEAAMRSLLLERRGSDLESSREVSELARVHAFDMAMRNFGGEIDPEGQGLTQRRERLAPKLVGEVRQWQILQIPEPTKDAAGIARDLVPIDETLTALLTEASWTELGVGTAIEDDRCGACVVFAARVPVDPDASN